MKFPTPFALGVALLFSLLVLGCGRGDSESQAEPLTREGANLVREEKYEEAVEKFDQAISLDSKFVPAYNNRGYAYDSLGEFERAIEDYNEAIRLDPEFSAAYNNRGFAQYHLGQYQLAIVEFDEAIRLNPIYADAYSGRSLANAYLGNDVQADRDFSRAVEFGLDSDELQAELEQVRRDR